MKSKVTDFVPPILTKLMSALASHMRGRIHQSQFDVTAYDYNAEKYWKLLHKKHGVDSLEGVGHGGLDEYTNRAWYASARYIFLGILNDLQINVPDRVMELGYGTGFYSRIMHELGVKKYLGLDIADQHISKLKHDMPEFNFEKHD